MNRVDNLNVFIKAHSITLDIYKITELFPKTETYGLVSQMRRAAVSIGSNLMEGGARNTNGEYKQFIGVARGSTNELKYQVMVARDLGFINKDVADNIIKESNDIINMLIGLAASL
jgi:four helix bundle protein